MGLFQHKQTHKKSSADEATDIEQRFFNENFREELRNHGRLYFEKVINENGALFKEDLDNTITQLTIDLRDHTVNQLNATITQLNSEIKDHVTKQLDAQFVEYGRVIKDAQDAALQSLNSSAQDLHTQHEQLSTTLKKSIANQEVMMSSSFQENMARMTEMKAAQAAALETLTSSAQAMQEQYQLINATLEKNVANQEAKMLAAFEGNMARIIEYYLLGALGDQYDLKAQLPSIIQQMEANKQAIMDDMKV